MKYKFIGNAYLLGVKLNEELIVFETDKDNTTLKKAVSNTLYVVKGYFRTRRSYLDLVETNSFVILDGDFYYGEEMYNMFDLITHITIEKMAYKTIDDKYAFFPSPRIVEQLYFMKIIGKNTFTKEEYRDAAITDREFALYYNDYLVPYHAYHIDKQYGTLVNAKYPGRWLIYNDEHKYYTQFENILQVKEVLPEDKNKKVI